MTTVDLHNEMERLREKLLDLSMRNPLLNYRKSKRRTLQIVDELPGVIYERLVAQGRKFFFDVVPDLPSSPETKEAGAVVIGIDAPTNRTSDPGGSGELASVQTVTTTQQKRYTMELPFL